MFCRKQFFKSFYSRNFSKIHFIITKHLIDQCFWNNIFIFRLTLSDRMIDISVVQIFFLFLVHWYAIYPNMLHRFIQTHDSYRDKLLTHTCRLKVWTCYMEVWTISSKRSRVSFSNLAIPVIWVGKLSCQYLGLLASYSFFIKLLIMYTITVYSHMECRKSIWMAWTLNEYDP